MLEALMFKARREPHPWCGPRIVRVLINPGSDVDARDNGGWTALIEASMTG